MNEPLLIACSDLHLCSTAPAFRSGEPDWWLSQKKSLDWLKALQKKYEVPVVIAGDIFDKAMGDVRTATHLVNFAADNLPFAYAIAGNHDLPYHNIRKKDEAAYGSLIRSRTIIDIEDTVRLNVRGVSIVLHGFWFGRALQPLKTRIADIHVAVVHEYVWAKEFGYSGVPDQFHSDVILGQLSGYDYWIFGDNHIGFQEGRLFNCGTFYRRTKGDEKYKPMVGILFSESGWRIELIPTESEIAGSKAALAQRIESSYDFTEFFDSLRQSESMVCDVNQILQNYLIANQVTEGVCRAIIEITS